MSWFILYCRSSYQLGGWRRDLNLLLLVTVFLFAISIVSLIVVKVFFITLAEIEYERRNGYAWYGTWATDLMAREYPAWKARLRLR